MTTISLREEFRDKRFRDEFVSAGVDNGLAFQIMTLRGKRGWTQRDLAVRAGVGAQPGVSRWEKPGHGFSLATLKKIAAAFDVALIVRFVPFSEVAEWTAALRPGGLDVPTFEEEEARRAATAGSSAPATTATGDIASGPGTSDNVQPLRQRIAAPRVRSARLSSSSPSMQSV